MSEEIKPNNPPAFPRLYPRADEDGTTGMTLRDWLAGKALTGILKDYQNDIDIPWTVKTAYEIADAMLAERSKNDPQPN